MIMTVGTLNKRISSKDMCKVWIYSYIGNLLGEAFDFMLSQMGTIKLINAISEDSSSTMWGIVAVWFIPFHYLYHFVLEKYYQNSIMN